MKRRKVVSTLLAFCLLLSLLPALGLPATAIEVNRSSRTVPHNIEAVAVSVDEPVLDMPITTASYIPEGYNGYTVANVSWEPNDTAYKKDVAYRVVVTLEAKENYVFPDGLTPYINKHPAQIITKSSQELKIAYTYPNLVPPMPSMFFDDVKTSDWFYGDVEYVYYDRLMSGVGNNRFDPQGNCTRGMIVTVLYRLSGCPEHSGKNPFSDVKTGTWYTDAVLWAADNGIVNGVGGGKFEPETDITREQLATILCRYAKIKGLYQEDDCAMLVGFSDYAKVSGWAVDSMSWAVGAGLIGGSNEKDGLYLMPEGNALRCQVAAILHRFCTNLK